MTEEAETFATPGKGDGGHLAMQALQRVEWECVCRFHSLTLLLMLLLSV